MYFTGLLNMTTENIWFEKVIMNFFLRIKQNQKIMQNKYCGYRETLNASNKRKGKLDLNKIWKRLY